LELKIQRIWEAVGICARRLPKLHKAMDKPHNVSTVCMQHYVDISKENIFVI
jgi:hypothetical protein